MGIHILNITFTSSYGEWQITAVKLLQNTDATLTYLEKTIWNQFIGQRISIQKTLKKFQLNKSLKAGKEWTIKEQIQISNKNQKRYST